MPLPLLMLAVLGAGLGASPTPTHTEALRRPVGRSAWPASLTQRPELRACLDLLSSEQHDLAAQCYRQSATLLAAARDQRRARALAVLAADMHRAVEGETLSSDGGSSLPTDLTAGRGQAGVLESVGFVLNSMAFGGWLGGLAGTYAPERTGLPVLGGAMLGLAASLPPLVLMDRVAAGDLALLRSGMLAGTLHALLGSTALHDARLEHPAVPAVMVGVSTLGLGLASLAVPFVDLPAAGVSLASSAALWGGGLTMLALLSLERQPDSWLAYTSVAAAHDLLLLGGLLAAPWLPVQHSEVWLLNTGAALGLLGGWALGSAVSGPAALDLGLEAGGLILGGAFGYLAGGLVHDELEAAGLSELNPLLGWQRLAQGVDDPRAERVLMAGLQLRY